MSFTKLLMSFLVGLAIAWYVKALRGENPYKSDGED